MIEDFRGAAKRLADIDLPRLGKPMGLGEDEIHAVLDVEARGSGFDALGRPAMLFEPHVFYGLLTKAGKLETRALAVAQGLAYKRWGAQQYPKNSYFHVEEAQALDPELALQSASWGLGQVMGFNHNLAGYSSAEAMVRAFMESEANQLEAMLAFITNANLARFLRAHDWARFAAGYNGPGFKKNGYDAKLAARFAAWQKIKDTPFP